MEFSFAGAQESLEGIRERKREDKLKEDDLELSRQNSLFQLAIAKREAQNKFKTSDKYLDAANSVVDLNQRLEGLDLTEDQQTYFNNLKTDPFATQEALKFVDEQETKYNTILQLPDLPVVFNIITSDTPVKEKIDLVEAITGADLRGKEGLKKFYSLANEITDIVTVPGRTVFTSITPGSRINKTALLTEQEAQIDALIGDVASEAQIWLSNNSGSEDADEVANLLGTEGIKSKEGSIRKTSLIALFNYKPENMDKAFGSPLRLYNMTLFNPALKGFEKSSIGQLLIKSFDYPSIDTIIKTKDGREISGRQLLEILRENDTPEARMNFDLRFGPGKAKELLGN
tara:strand:+ start:82 stop:1113 length:1032 start_codon:yes stop_codon:yes gene_type:complete